MTSSPITDEEVLRFLEHGFRNIDLPPLSRDDLRDIAGGLASMRSSAPPVMGMEEMVERCARAIESGSGNPDTFAGTVSDTARRDARVVLEASGLLSTPLVTGRE
jgi:hypothetical protein